MDEGWCEGMFNGKKGRFRDKFVRFQKSTQLPPDPKESPNVCKLFIYADMTFSQSDALKSVL